MVTDTQLGALWKLAAIFNVTGSPLVDIAPDLTMWPGVPLGETRSLYDFDDMAQAIDWFRQTVRERKKRAGMLAECEPCDLRARAMCTGGHVTHQLSEVAIEQVHSDPGRRILAVV
jgi:hypothetical protein